MQTRAALQEKDARIGGTHAQAKSSSLRAELWAVFGHMRMHRRYFGLLQTLRVRCLLPRLGAETAPAALATFRIVINDLLSGGIPVATASEREKRRQ